MFFLSFVHSLSMREVAVDGKSLTIEGVVEVALGRAKAFLPDEVRDRLVRGREELEELLSKGEIAYGINTGVGDMQNVIIPGEQILRLQRNLVRSTACGLGPLLSAETVRAMMLLRANALAKGHSGVRLALVELLMGMLERGVIPVVPSRGSVGSSGDLVPLAHMALVMMGEGEAFFDGERVTGAGALRAADLLPIELKVKEGLAIINGTQMMTAVGSLCLKRAFSLLKVAQIAVAMSLEALKGTDRSFDPRLGLARPHPGQARVSSNLRALLEGSEILASHRECPRVQDAYTLRCAPQVLGACLDAMEWVRKVMEVEINSATDNPLIFDGEAISGGNFHGEPVAMSLDLLGLAVSEMAAFSERRTARLVDGRLSCLPSFLTKESGLESGMMIPQYLAASLVSESRLLCHPATADSIPTSANQEDFNSMGSVAALKLETMVANAERVVAIELLCAAQGLEFHEALPGKGVRSAHEFIRRGVPPLVNDRPLSRDIEWIRERMADGSLLAHVEKTVALD